jgi:SAM-dependent methyltransferase
MSDKQNLRQTYRPTHDEAARQAFVGALKGYVNGPLEQRLAAEYESEIGPAYAREHGQPPQNREEGNAAFANNHTFGVWGAATFVSQDLMWETVGETCERVLPDFARRRQDIEKGQTLGRLELNPDLEIPEPIRDIEIHRQPGGYFDDEVEDGLLTGLHYFGTIELYRNAKGLGTGANVGEPGMGRYLLGALKRRYPDLKPKRILDLGCGAGVETLAYKEAFPDAEVWGVDIAAPLLSFAHTWAEDCGFAVNYRQADARATGFPDGHFDLVMSHILFHETWHDILPAIMREANRILAPGGVFLNGDTPYQPARLSIPKQVTNDWQVINNGEPFWTGYVDMSMRDELIKAGFDEDRAFADWDPLGQGEYHIFGGSKAAA